jgi:hypothetical protein
MATHTLGTKSSSSLVAVQYSTTLLAADVATLNAQVLDDQYVQNAAVIGTCSTHSNTTLDTFSAGTLAGIPLGAFIIGSGIPAGAIVVAKGATSLTLSAAATATASGVHIVVALQPFQNAFSLLGTLYVPNRGYLNLLPNDYIGVGPSGEIILVPNEAVAYAGSAWTFT